MKNRIWTMCLAFLGLGMIVGFQNCAPSGPGLTAGLADDVTIIDRWNSQKVSFPVSTYYVGPDVDSVNIDGLCHADVYAIRWVSELKDASGQEFDLTGGLANCSDGVFHIVLDQADEVLQDCDSHIKILAVAQDASGTTASAFLKKQCF